MPYTYVVVHKKSGSWYYGVRTKAGCQPEDLWSTYFTSSKRVHDLLKQDGKDSFTVAVRRVFSSESDAILWEHRVLRRILGREKCLNECAFPAVTQEARARGNKKRGEVGSDGLTGYQRATLKWMEKRDKINPETGVTFEEERRLKSKMTRDAAPPEVKAERKRKNQEQVKVMNTPEVRQRAHDSLRKRVEAGTFPTTKGRKFPSISEKLKGKQFTLGLVWANDGKQNYRLQPDDARLQTLARGRLIESGAASKGFKQREITCPHCGKTGANTNMKRYHFDNCKSKKID